MESKIVMSLKDHPSGAFKRGETGVASKVFDNGCYQVILSKGRIVVDPENVLSKGDQVKVVKVDNFLSLDNGEVRTVDCILPKTGKIKIGVAMLELHNIVKIKEVWRMPNATIRVPHVDLKEQIERKKVELELLEQEYEKSIKTPIVNEMKANLYRVASPVNERIVNCANEIRSIYDDIRKIHQRTLSAEEKEFCGDCPSHLTWDETFEHYCPMGLICSVTNGNTIDSHKGIVLPEGDIWSKK